ncbi:hypothetical protein SAMN05421545_1579 [Pontibacter lucknowensis]|uniref:Uncharacterized protein n=1 Tax=Pontibacter lucknowensis TaxID=1077936 RepID=A0A1N6WJJ8_9BACT|nr:hypothetical protein SAMN05421545_1579 [Pontibacter lucknowensis]
MQDKYKKLLYKIISRLGELVGLVLLLAAVLFAARAW